MTWELIGKFAVIVLIMIAFIFPYLLISEKMWKKEQEDSKMEEGE